MPFLWSTQDNHPDSIPPRIRTALRKPASSPSVSGMSSEVSLCLAAPASTPLRPCVTLETGKDRTVEAPEVSPICTPSSLPPTSIAPVDEAGPSDVSDKTTPCGAAAPASTATFTFKIPEEKQEGTATLSTSLIIGDKEAEKTFPALDISLSTDDPHNDKPGDKTHEADTPKASFTFGAITTDGDMTEPTFEFNTGPSFTFSMTTIPSQCGTNSISSFAPVPASVPSTTVCENLSGHSVSTKPVTAKDSILKLSHASNLQTLNPQISTTASSNAQNSTSGSAGTSKCEESTSSSSISAEPRPDCGHGEKQIAEVLEVSPTCTPSSLPPTSIAPVDEAGPSDVSDKTTPCGAAAPASTATSTFEIPEKQEATTTLSTSLISGDKKAEKTSPALDISLSTDDPHNDKPGDKTHEADTPKASFTFGTITADQEASKSTSEDKTEPSFSFSMTTTPSQCGTNSISSFAPVPASVPSTTFVCENLSGHSVSTKPATAKDSILKLPHASNLQTLNPQISTTASSNAQNSTSSSAATPASTATFTFEIPEKQEATTTLSTSLISGDKKAEKTFPALDISLSTADPHNDKPGDKTHEADTPKASFTFGTITAGGDIPKPTFEVKTGPSFSFSMTTTPSQFGASSSSSAPVPTSIPNTTIVSDNPSGQTISTKLMTAKDFEFKLPQDNQGTSKSTSEVQGRPSFSFSMTVTPRQFGNNSSSSASVPASVPSTSFVFGQNAFTKPMTANDFEFKLPQDSKCL
ncbi:mucin-5AC-like [Megalops cyprinoides]|uniref:mucin-5AC-like n=1 Tax=Megalops cyprinoides TaxID=118141 RepID=UPI0018643A60|nr:mucin-5AC-like [Megalops cyprinoides]